MIIFDGDCDDATVKRYLDQANKLVENGGGRVATTSLLDATAKLIAVKEGQTSGFAAAKRRFAYEINKKWEGIYVVLEIATEATDLHDLERVLRLADEVVRHKTLRLPDSEAAKRGLSVAAASA
jgi:small subunit ribosomal protein S6